MYKLQTPRHPCRLWCKTGSNKKTQTPAPLWHAERSIHYKQLNVHNDRSWSIEKMKTSRNSPWSLQKIQTPPWPWHWKTSDTTNISTLLKACSKFQGSWPPYFKLHISKVSHGPPTWCYISLRSGMANLLEVTYLKGPSWPPYLMLHVSKVPHGQPTWYQISLRSVMATLLDVTNL